MINKRRSMYNNDVFAVSWVSKSTYGTEMVEALTSAMVMTVSVMLAVMMMAMMVMEVTFAQSS